ncbi:hypothetical protein BDW71DRAFT_209206 [Aspergillus fruticulosus]
MPTRFAFLYSIQRGPLVIWGLIEQNVVIVAAYMPTLRPFFRRAFESRGSSNKSSSLGSGSKLSSTAWSKRHMTAAELVLEESQNQDDRGMGFELGFDVERGSQGSGGQSHSSRQGIWQTREVIVQSDKEEGSKRMRELGKLCRRICGDFLSMFMTVLYRWLDTIFRTVGAPPNPALC